MTESKRDRYIYKVLTPNQWASFQAEGTFVGSPVDLADGFIHMSCAAQLKETMDKWYVDQSAVAVLQIKAAEINEELKYEVSRGGAEFPHLFADLPISAVGQVWLVSPVNGAYTLPDDLNAN
mgnify:CR=1 FL=1